MQVLWFAWLGWAHTPELFITSAEEDWCAVIDAALTGDTIMLEPGTYQGPCSIESNPPDLPGERMHILSLDAGQPAELVPGPGGAALEVLGPEVTLSALAVRGIGLGQTGVIVRDKNAEIQFLDLEVTGGVGVALTGSAGAPWVHDVRIWGGEGTGVEVGCVEGDCAVTSFVLSDNWVSSGTGVHVHPGTSGVVRDTVVDEALVGMRLEGSTEAVGNLVWGGVAVRALGGPVVLHNNLLFGVDYGVWLGEGAGTLSADVRHNSVRADGEPFMLEGEQAEIQLGSNAVLGDLPEKGGWRDLGGNVSCPEGAACWLDGPSTGLVPKAKGLLVEAGVSFAELANDWCGGLRSAPPLAGALEQVGVPGEVEAGFKHQIECRPAKSEAPVYPETGDTAGEGPTSETAVDTGREPAACPACEEATNDAKSQGCSTAPSPPRRPPALWWWAMCAVGWAWRRGRARDAIPLSY